MIRSHEHNPARWIISMAAIAAVLTGCAGNNPRGNATISPEDFAPPPAPPAPPSSPSSPSTSSDTSPSISTANTTITAAAPPTSSEFQVTRIDRATASEGIMDITAQAGPPQAPSAEAVPIGPPVLVDEKVGDINGHPIYISRFFAPLDARLRAEAVRRPRNEWILFAAGLIKQELRRQIQDELLKNEALASLSGQQRVGLRAFVEQWRGTLASQSYGSASRAERKLRESDSAMTVDEWLAQQENRALIEHLLDTKISTEVHVTPRDVREYYERHYEEFNPPPVAHFRLIMVRADAQEDVMQIKDKLDAGEPFEKVASLPINRHRPDKGGLADDRVIKGEFGKSSFFGPRELNKAAQQLEPGRWAGPIRFGPEGRQSVAWLMLDEIHQPEQRSLFDVQSAIEQQLIAQFTEDESNRYFRKLLKKGSFTDPMLMGNRLLQVAIERYLPAEPDKPVSDAGPR